MQNMYGEDEVLLQNSSRRAEKIEMPYRTSTIDFIVDNYMNFSLPVDISPKNIPIFTARC